jgi:hypothetical protein
MTAPGALAQQIESLQKVLAASIDARHRVLLLAVPVESSFESSEPKTPATRARDRDFWRVRTVDLSRLGGSRLVLHSIAHSGSQVRIGVDNSEPVKLDLTLMERWGIPFDGRPAAHPGQVSYQFGEDEWHLRGEPGLSEALLKQRPSMGARGATAANALDAAARAAICLALAANEPVRPSDVDTLPNLLEGLKQRAESAPILADSLTKRNGFQPLFDEYLRQRGNATTVMANDADGDRLQTTARRTPARSMAAGCSSTGCTSRSTPATWDRISTTASISSSK